MHEIYLCSYFFLTRALFNVLLYRIELICSLILTGDWKSYLDCSSFITSAEADFSGSSEKPPTG